MPAFPCRLDPETDAVVCGGLQVSFCVAVLGGLLHPLSLTGPVFEITKTEMAAPDHT